MDHTFCIEAMKQTFQNRPIGIQGTRGEYAVLVPLVEVEGELCLLFEVRAHTLRGQPGEVCFPGGRIEAGESPWEAALRETCEEIGICEESVTHIAPLDLIFDLANRLIHPFLVQIEKEALATMRPNPSEVHQVFFSPLRALKEQEPFVYKAPVVLEVDEDFPYEKIGYTKGNYSWRSGAVDVSSYEFEGHKIWGLTGRTVRWLLQRLEEEGF